MAAGWTRSEYLNGAAAPGGNPPYHFETSSTSSFCPFPCCCHRPARRQVERVCGGGGPARQAAGHGLCGGSACSHCTLTIVYFSGRRDAQTSAWAVPRAVNSYISPLRWDVSMLWPRAFATPFIIMLKINRLTECVSFCGQHCRFSTICVVSTMCIVLCLSSSRSDC
jgi:hypothetical protein